MATRFEELSIEEFEREVRDRFEQMTQLLVAKRLSYGTSNLVRHGPIGVVIRASDKIDRLTNMCHEGATANVDGDTMDDAWADLIGYGVLGLLLTQLERNTQLTDKEVIGNG